MIETEKATNRFDLPHTFEGASTGAIVCRCGRSSRHDLHAPSAREVAHAGRGVLPRELGS